MEKESGKSEGITFLGRNIAEIPCFSDSYFYGICTGIFGGFAFFMLTSRVRLATHVSMGTFCVSTLSYWTYCRLKYAQQIKETELLREFMKEQIIKGGLEDTVEEPVTV